jgi:hypothetical protein
MTELRDFADQDCPVVPVYYYLGGQYRVDMKTSDACYVPSPSGSVDFDTQGWYSGQERNDLEEDAKKKCLAKARDMQVNVAVMLGEGRQTISMLADTARTLGNAYRNFRRGRFNRAAKELGIKKPQGTSANHWLAYQYGWMPLLSDAKGLYVLNAQGLISPTRKHRFTAKASTKKSKRVKWTADGQGASNLPGGKTEFVSDTEMKATAGLLLEYTSSHSGLNSVGLGRYDPLLTAWELVPFSFVFDWFIDIGGYLQALSSLDGLAVLAGFESSSVANYGNATMVIPGTSGWHGSVAPSAIYRWRSYRRVDFTGSVSLRTPLWDGFNARRLITTAALMRQRTRGDREFGSYRP